jgi:PST family polysaccharide transporter
LQCVAVDRAGSVPVLAAIQDDIARVRAVTSATALVGLVTFPMCLGLFATEPLMLGVFGPQWGETVPILRLLSLAGLVQSITALPTIVYLSQGRPELQLRVTLLERLVTIPAILAGLGWGIVGVAAAYLAATIVNAVPSLYLANRLIALPLRALATALAPVLLAGVAMAASVVAIDAWAPPLDVRALLALEVVAGVLGYWTALRCLRVRAYADAIGLLRRPALSADGA